MTTPPPPHLSHVFGQFSETFSYAHLLIVFFVAQGIHRFILLTGDPAKNCDVLSSHAPSSKGIVVVVGASVGRVVEGSHIPHVTGQFSLTSGLLEHLPEVLPFLSAQLQVFLLLSDSI